MNPHQSALAAFFDGSRTGTLHFDETHHFATGGPVRAQPRVQVIEARLRELEAELADIKRFGQDTYEDGDVITFKGDYNGPKTYAYAAIKAGGKWHLTGGKAIQHASWDALVEFMRKANVRKVRRVTETERIV